MKIYTDISQFTPLKKAVVTIGTFDGVHIGHQELLRKLRESAKSIGAETVILTFFPHPRMIIHPEDQGIRLINTVKEKTELLGYLRSKLHNHDISIHIKVNENISSKKAYTAQDKYNRLNEINPNLQVLKKMFDLDI